MALAAAEDVKRYLPDPDRFDESDINDVLDAVTDWVERYTGRDWDASGTVTEKFWNVRWDAVLQLKDENPTNVVVTVFALANDTGFPLTENKGYQVIKGGKVQLFFNRLVSPAGLPEARAQRLPGYYHRVEVQYTASNSVPKPVKEAVAMITASTLVQRHQVTGVQSEKLGDYSYSADLSVDVPPLALKMLDEYAQLPLRSV